MAMPTTLQGQQNRTPCEDPMPLNRTEKQFSIVVATDQRISETDVLGFLHGLAGLAVPGEVILVSDAQEGVASTHVQQSLNDTVTLCRLTSASRSRSLKKNLALTFVQSPLVIFLADDFLMTADAVRVHLDFHQRHPQTQYVALGLAHIPPQQQTLYNREIEQGGLLFGVPLPAKSSVRDMERGIDFYFEGNTSLKTALLQRCGPHNPLLEFDCTDDWEYGVRLKALGVKCFYLPQADLIHHHRVEILERFKSTVQSGYNLARLGAGKTLPPDSPVPQLLHCLSSVKTAPDLVTFIRPLAKLLELSGLYCGAVLFRLGLPPSALYALQPTLGYPDDFNQAYQALQKVQTLSRQAGLQAITS